MAATIVVTSVDGVAAQTARWNFSAPVSAASFALSDLQASADLPVNFFNATSKVNFGPSSIDADYSFAGDFGDGNGVWQLLTAPANVVTPQSGIVSP